MCAWAKVTHLLILIIFIQCTFISPLFKLYVKEKGQFTAPILQFFLKAIVLKCSALSVCSLRLATMVKSFFRDLLPIFCLVFFRILFWFCFYLFLKQNKSRKKTQTQTLYLTFYLHHDMPFGDIVLVCFCFLFVFFFCVSLFLHLANREQQLVPDILFFS